MATKPQKVRMSWLTVSVVLDGAQRSVRTHEYACPQIVVFGFIELESLIEGLLGVSRHRARCGILVILAVVGGWWLLILWSKVFISVVHGLRRILHLGLHWICLLGLGVPSIVVALGLAMRSHVFLERGQSCGKE